MSHAAVRRILFLIFFFIPCIARGNSTGLPCSGGEFSSPATKSWSNDVIYEIFVDRFAAAEGDGTVSGNRDAYQRQGGTIDGVIKKLDYLKNLGITAILLNPMTVSDAYHGYSVMDLNHIDAHYGGDEAYGRLVTEVHKRGMKILFDLVLNHTSGNAPLVKAHPDWYRPIDKISAVNDPFIPEVWGRTTFFFLRDLKQENPETYQYLLDAALHWMSTGIDGFRMDGVTLIEPWFWERFNAEIRLHAKKDFLILGEIFHEGIQFLNLYEKPFDAFFDFPTWRHLSYLDRGFVLGFDLQDWWSLDNLYANRNALPFTFIDNHDVSRYAQEASQADRINHIKPALALIFATRGVPVILYGTEIGLGDDPALASSRYDRSRARMQFQKNEQHPLFKHIKALIAARRAFNFNYCTKIEIPDPPQLYTALLHDSEKRNLLVIVNPTGNKFPALKYNVQYYDEYPKNGSIRDVLNSKDKIPFKDGYIIAPEIGPFESKFFEITAGPQ